MSVTESFLSMLNSNEGESSDETSVLPRRRATLTSEKIEIAVSMFNNNQTTKAVADVLKCSIRTAQNIKNKSFSTTVNSQPYQVYEQGQRGRKQDGARIQSRRQVIRNILTGEPDLLQTDIIDRLPERCSQSTVSRDIKDMKWSRKRLQIIPYERNSANNIQKRREYSQMIHHIDDNKLIFIDETGHNLHLTQRYGYAPAGEPAIRQINGNRGRNLTAIVAISMAGLVHYKLVEGAANATIFYEFLDELERHLPSNPVLIMDNVRFHHGQLVRRWINEHSQSVRVEYLPPYSPELNPIEEFFSMEKNTYRRINHPVARTTQILKQRVISVFESLRGKNLSPFFRHMRNYVAMGLSGQSFL